MKKIRIATLTPQEDKAWVDAFNWSMEQHKSAKRADRYAFATVRDQFPRLKKFDKLAP